MVWPLIWSWNVSSHKADTSTLEDSVWFVKVDVSVRLKSVVSLTLMPDVDVVRKGLVIALAFETARLMLNGSSWKGNVTRFFCCICARALSLNEDSAGAETVNEVIETTDVFILCCGNFGTTRMNLAFSEHVDHTFNITVLT